MHRLLIGLLIVVASCSVAAAQDARMGWDKNFGSVGKWGIGYNSKRSHCLAAVTYRSGTVLFIGIDRAKRIGVIGFFNKKWSNVENGKTHIIEYRSRRKRWKGATLGGWTRWGGGYFAERLSPAFLVNLVRSGWIEIRRNGRKLGRLSMRGARNALNETVKCQVSNTNNLDADRYYRPARRVADNRYRRSSESWRQGQKYYSRGMRALKRNNYSQAVMLLEKALGIVENRIGRNHYVTARVLYSLAQAYSFQGRLREAETFFKGALQIIERKTDREARITLYSALNGLGNVYLKQRRLSKAERLYRRSLRIAEAVRGKDHPELALMLKNLRSVFLQTERIPDAIALSKRSLAIRKRMAGENSLLFATSLDDLAWLLAQIGRFSEAEAYYMQSLSIREAKQGKNHIDVANTLNKLGSLYLSVGRYSEAEQLHLQVLDIKEKILGKKNSSVALTLSSLASSYLHQGRYSTASSLLERAFEISSVFDGTDHPFLLQVRNNLIIAYNGQGHYSKSLPHIQHLLEAGDYAPKAILEGVYGAQQKQLITSSRAFADAYKALQFTLTSSAAKAVNKLAARHAAGTSKISKLVRRLQDLKNAHSETDKALIAEISKSRGQRSNIREGKLRQKLAKIAAERRSIDALLEAEFPEYVALVNPRPLTLEETQKLLTSDEAVVAFHIGEERSFAFIVTKTEGYWIEIPAKKKEVQDFVERLRQPMVETDVSTFDVDAAYGLYNTIMAPIAKKLVGKAKISVVLHGALTSIPLGMLITSAPETRSLKDQNWLIRTHAITVIPSIYALRTMRAVSSRHAAPKKMIAFADPEFGNRGKPTASRSLASFYRGSKLDTKSLCRSLAQLPGTRSEVTRIAKSLRISGEDIRLGTEATETAVKRSNLEQYQIVYFATHGLVAGQLQDFAKFKAEPSLVLTCPRAPTRFDNGLLEASEIAQLSLNADWAVLSACNTAAAKNENAEALSGLARAFLYAGARSLVVSHWEVSDEATVNLMSAVFEIADQNPRLTHGQAMQKAMLKMLDKATTNTEAHPFFWAPFIVVGESLPQ